MVLFAPQKAANSAAMRGSGPDGFYIAFQLIVVFGPEKGARRRFGLGRQGIGADGKLSPISSESSRFNWRQAMSGLKALILGLICYGEWFSLRLAPKPLPRSTITITA